MRNCELTTYSVNAKQTPLKASQNRHRTLVGGRCVATLAMLARVDTSKPTTRNAVARGRNRPFQKTERRSYWAVSFPNIVTYGKR